jgi:hypothetical protein
LEKAEADRKADREETKAYREDLKEIKSGQAELRSIVNAWLTDMRNTPKETMACQETMEARLEEKKPASMDMTPEVAQEQVVPLEDVIVMPVGEPRKGVGTDDIWPRCATRRNRIEIWRRGVAGRNRNGPRGKMGAEGTWSLPAE